MNGNYESRSIIECYQRQDWPKWEEAIQEKLSSFTKQEIFRLVTQTLDNVKHVEYKWIFVRKQEEHNEIVKYNA